MKLALRICSSQKHVGQTLPLDNMYEPCAMLKAFFKRCQYSKIPYGILSRKYGVVARRSFVGHQHDGYPDEDMLVDSALLHVLRLQARHWYRGYELVYWNHRPLTHNKWVSLLREAGFSVVEVKTLDELQEEFL